jgi:alcohol dehydrogenase YqhD (iron-dependent ADH family)
MGVPANEDKIIAAKEGISKLRAFFKAMGLPTKLSDFDIDDSRIEEMADKATKFGMIGQFRKLDRDDVLEIFKMMV